MAFDVDIDVSPEFKKLIDENPDRFELIRASVYDDERRRMLPHPSGYYSKDHVFVDSLTGRASFDYKDGEGFFNKVDILTNTIYKHFKSKNEVLDLANREPDWESLMDEEFVSRLPHIGNHYDLIKSLKPKNIHDLADALALMRPGKVHLVQNYIKHKEATRLQLYKKPTNGQHYFKKSHSYAYAKTIILMMNFYKNGKNPKNVFGFKS